MSSSDEQPLTSSVVCRLDPHYPVGGSGLVFHQL